jgi:hypothetical protein
MKLEFFLNGKTHGLGPQHCGPMVCSGPRWTESGADKRRGAPGAVGPGSSPAATEDEEGKEV